MECTKGELDFYLVENVTSTGQLHAAIVYEDCEACAISIVKNTYYTKEMLTPFTRLKAVRIAFERVPGVHYVVIE
jgi:hypothetical protein